jgi:hypothetical protein
MLVVEIYKQLNRKVGSMQMGVAVEHYQALHNHFPKDAKEN